MSMRASGGYNPSNVAITGGTIQGSPINLALRSATIGRLDKIASADAPTITYGASALGGSQTINPFNGSGALNTRYFGFHGVNTAYIKTRGLSSPQTQVAVAASANANTLGAQPFVTTFYYTPGGNTSSLDIKRYGDATRLDILVDDKYVGGADVQIASGTAQAGAATTITLAAGASASDGYYNQCYVRITGGTGSGQIRKISSYVGATKVATIGGANWSTNPDATSTYSIEHTPIGFFLDGLTGSVNYINLTFPADAPVQNRTRKITLISSQFFGVNIGQNDSVTAGPPMGQFPAIVVGDSYWEGTASPLNNPILAQLFAVNLGLQLVNLGSGSTGLWTRGSNNRLNFLNRIAPPTEAWEVTSPANNGATAGTWTISVTYNGTTQTTSALAYNASAATVESALNALSFNGFNASSGVAWVGPTGQGCFCVARGDGFANTPFVIIANGMAGATLTVNGGGLTGGTALTVTQYLGDVAKNIPTDAGGNAVPFLLFVAGSGNDVGATGYTTAQLQDNVSRIAIAINTKFPSAIAVFSGIVSTSPGSGVIASSDVANNTAIKNGIASLPKINAQAPFIDTYWEGVGGNALITGGGWVAGPSNGNNDIFRSIIATGHPTGNGAVYFASVLSARLLKIFRGIADGP